MKTVWYALCNCSVPKKGHYIFCSVNDRQSDSHASNKILNAQICSSHTIAHIMLTPEYFNSDYFKQILSKSNLSSSFRYPSVQLGQFSPSWWVWGQLNSVVILACSMYPPQILLGAYLRPPLFSRTAEFKALPLRNN